MESTLNQSDVDNLVLRIRYIKARKVNIVDDAISSLWNELMSVYQMFYNRPEQCAFGIMEGLLDILENKIDNYQPKTAIYIGHKDLSE